MLRYIVSFVSFFPFMARKSILILHCHSYKNFSILNSAILCIVAKFETHLIISHTCDCKYVLLKPKSDIHCNRSATSPRPKFKTIAEVAEESQLGFAVGRRLVGDWSATNRGLVADSSATGRRPRGDLFAT